MAYIGNSPGVASQRVVTTFTATSGQTTFTPSSGYTLGYCDVFYNGVKLVDGDDYTAANGVNVVLATGAAAGDSVEIVAHFPRGLSDGYTQAEANARYAQRSNNLSDLSSASTARTNLGLGNVENKSSATIRGELTSGNVTGALGYTPVNKAGDTITGRLESNYAFGDADPAIRLNGTSASGSFQHGSHSLSPSLGSSQSVIHVFGRAASSKNAAYVGFRYSGTPGGDNNTGSLGLWGVDHVLQWDGRGCVTMQYQPSFLAFGSKSITAGSWQLISDGFTSTQHNVASCYNTSNGRFTAPVAGRYAFYCGGFANLAGNGERYAFNARINGGSQSYIGGGNYSQVDTPISGYSVVVALSAGDYVDLLSFSALAVSYGSGPHQFYFGGYLLG